MRQVFVASAAALALLGGCATRYKSPTGTPTAKLAFQVRGSPEVVTQVKVHPEAGCGESSNGGLIGAVKAGPIEHAVDIPADLPFTFSMHGLGFYMWQTRECPYTARFTPTEGGYYVATLTVGNEVSMCRMSIEERSATPFQPMPVDVPEFSCANGDGKQRNTKIIVTNRDVYVPFPLIPSGKGR